MTFRVLCIFGRGYDGVYNFSIFGWGFDVVIFINVVKFFCVLEVGSVGFYLFVLSFIVVKIVERIYFGEIDGSFFIIICFYLVGRVVIFVWGMKGSVYVFFMVGRFIGCYLLEIFGGDMVIGYDGGICVLIGVLIIIIIFFFL